MNNNQNYYDKIGSTDFPKMWGKLNDLADALAEQIYQQNFLSVLTLNNCVQYFYSMKQQYNHIHTIYGFVLSIKKNLDPRNENDCFVVVQALLDNHNKPVIVNNETVSRILHTRTIDDALIRAMDGKETKMFTVGNS